MTDTGETAETAQSPSTSGTTKAPGWYPDRINPNIQNYWDGHGWSAQRRWMSGRWFDVQMGPSAGEVPLGASGGAPGRGAASGAGAGAGPVPRATPVAPPPGANPYVNLPPHLYAQATSLGQSRASANSVTIAMMGLLACSVIIIVGSLTPWITVSIGGIGSSINGSDAGISSVIGINGWLTFAGGIVLFLLVGLTAVTGERVFRVSTVLLALAVTGLATYDMVRVVQKINSFPSASSSSIKDAPSFLNLHLDITVGWGLIILLIGAVGAILFALADLKSP